MKTPSSARFSRSHERCVFTDAHAQLVIRRLIGLEQSLGVKGESETLTSSLGPQRQLEQKRKRKTEESEEEKEMEILM